MDADREPGLAGESAAAASAAGLGLILGSATAGPIGALAGAAMGPPILRAFERVGAELATRGFGRRQVDRIQTAATVAAEEIADRLSRGEQPRSDYLDPDAEGRCTAEELLDQVTMLAADTADERKVPLLGRLNASLLFAADIPPENARFISRLVERLTYRQLLCIAAAKANEDPGAGIGFAFEHTKALRKIDGNWVPMTPGLAAELDDLSSAGVIGIRDTEEQAKERGRHMPGFTGQRSCGAGEVPGPARFGNEKSSGSVRRDWVTASRSCCDLMTFRARN